MTTDGLPAAPRDTGTGEGAGRPPHQGGLATRGPLTTTVPVIPLWERLTEGGR
jgi:hypothetical protein